MGASGRVCRLLLSHWRDAPTKDIAVKAQSRQAGFDLQWSPLDDGPPPLERFVQIHGKPKAIIALIGATPTTQGDMAQTTALAVAVIKAAERAGIARVVFASSSAVYPLNADLTEDVPPAPTSPYGLAKLEMEQAVASLQTIVDVCCLRIGNVAGADALLGQAERATKDTPIALDQFPDGNGPLRSYISPQKLAACLEQIAHHNAPLPDVLNCASSSPVEMAALLDAADLDWVWTPAAASRMASQKITLDCTLLGHIVGDTLLDADPSDMIADLRKLGVLD
ncbi:NAD-dependent epimerase/dehydratase family protein [uncultured Litoreibacter sp.]|uniref:NAD-dependent epimerase/dehydratase family protein n=1 Tax=uncultured Litoreibacter sp. TaxID=1392394 RepID=UPI00262950F8|nr:NAD-dependent epimerase/dehydratase family protein [uncultured Litoreibacter sp.]